MCGIFASSDQATLDKLAVLNSSRGSASWSVTALFESLTTKLYQRIRIRKLGKYHKFDTFSDHTYFIGHIQAPTSGVTSSATIHPANIGKSSLWHNGIIKTKGIDKDTTDPEKRWDTFLLLEGYLLAKDNDRQQYLSNIAGSFACLLFHNGKLSAFRNDRSPLFIDAKLNISSVEFKGSKALEPNIVWEFDFESKTLINTLRFEGSQPLYYIPE